MFLRSRSTSAQSHERSIESYSHRIRMLPQPKKNKKLTLDQTAMQHVSPYLSNMHKCLDKIGSIPASQFQPAEEDKKSFRVMRYN
jgi:hypothetical protein